MDEGQWGGGGGGGGGNELHSRYKGGKEKKIDVVCLVSVAAVAIR